ncbi:uncharacterized protein [Montipora foliosa]|uniref:uncharacterized protein isoform X1 n=2 Tax=Montipora foliosa TaxID=591990 RepID=UPI0035F21225
MVFVTNMDRGFFFTAFIVVAVKSSSVTITPVSSSSSSITTVSSSSSSVTPVSSSSSSITTRTPTSSPIPIAFQSASNTSPTTQSTSISTSSTGTQSQSDTVSSNKPSLSSHQTNKGASPGNMSHTTGASLILTTASSTSASQGHLSSIPPSVTHVIPGNSTTTASCIKWTWTVRPDDCSAACSDVGGTVTASCQCMSNGTANSASSVCEKHEKKPRSCKQHCPASSARTNAFGSFQWTVAVFYTSALFALLT